MTRVLGRPSAPRTGGWVLGAALLLGAASNAQAGANSLNLFNQREGLHVLSVATLATVSGYTANQLDTWLQDGRYALWSGGKLRAWHYDAAARQVYFAAEGYDTEDTDRNAYRLYRDWNRTNARPMLVVQAEGPAAGVPGAFPETIVLEEDKVYAPWALTDPNGRYWFWDHLLRGTAQDRTQVELPLDLPDPSPADCGVGPRLRAHLRGSSNVSTGVDHQVLGVLNGGPKARVVFDGFDARVLQIRFESNVLAPNGNRLILTSEPRDGVSQALERIDRVEVDYCREMRARDGQLWLHGVGPGVVTVAGLPGPDIAVIQDPAGETALWREDRTVVPDGEGGWQVSFPSESAEPMDFLVAHLGAAYSPEVEVDDPSTLSNTANQADYLIVAPKREMQAAAEALAAHRGAQGLNVRIAWLQDVYDQFSQRRANPDAIGSFLKTVLTWERVPTHVVFLGRGTLNHKGRPDHFPGESLIPVTMASGPWGLFPSDNRYCDTSGDGVPEFACGRIPAETSEEALAYIAKLEGFETAALDSWVDRAIGVADDPDPAAGDFHADALAEEARLANLFWSVSPLHYQSGADVIAFREGLFSEWNSGAALVAYWGHGATELWGASTTDSFLRSDIPSSSLDAAGLSNAPQLPIVGALTCLAGNDTFPGFTALAAALVANPVGGAIATLMPTGASLHASAVTLGSGFFDALAGEPAQRTTVGEAAQAAKERAAEAGVPVWELDLYDVTGEPLVRLH